MTRSAFIVTGAASVVARAAIVSNFIVLLFWYQIASRHCLTFLCIFKVFRRVFLCSSILLSAYSFVMALMIAAPPDVFRFHDFDYDPTVGDRYLLLPVPDAKQKIYISTDGHCYSRRIEVDPADHRKRSGLYCCANRFLVDAAGAAILHTVCTGTFTHPCRDDHKPTQVMFKYHFALRAAKLIATDLLERGVIGPAISKPQVCGILTDVFAAYAPGYPDLDVGAIFETRRRGFRHIFEKDVPVGGTRRPWAVVRGEDPPDLYVEMARERLRWAAFDVAHAASILRFPVPDPAEEAEREELEVQDAGPALDGLMAAMRAQSEAVGMPISSFSINYVGPQGGRRRKRHTLPPPE